MRIIRGTSLQVYLVLLQDRHLGAGHLYRATIGTCRDAYFLLGFLTIIAKLMYFYMILEDHAFNLGFWLVFLSFPYGFPWGRLVGTPQGSCDPPGAPQWALWAPLPKNPVTNF